MKKFNATGVFRKDARKETKDLDLNADLKGASLEETKRSLDDTLLYGELTVEELEQVRAGQPKEALDRELEDLVNKRR